MSNGGLRYGLGSSESGANGYSYSDFDCAINLSTQPPPYEMASDIAAQNNIPLQSMEPRYNEGQPLAGQGHPASDEDSAFFLPYL